MNLNFKDFGRKKVFIIRNHRQRFAYIFWTFSQQNWLPLTSRICPFFPHLAQFIYFKSPISIYFHKNCFNKIAYQFQMWKFVKSFVIDYLISYNTAPKLASWNIFCEKKEYPFFRQLVHPVYFPYSFPVKDFLTAFKKLVIMREMMV